MTKRTKALWGILTTAITLSIVALAVATVYGVFY